MKDGSFLTWLATNRLVIGHAGQTLHQIPDIHLASDDPCLCIIGPSGVGKTTLLLTLAGQLNPLSGSAAIYGPKGVQQNVRPVVFQQPLLIPWLTAAGNVELALKCRGVPKADRAPQARTWLDRLGLKDAAQLRPHALSGGMAQRVNLARCFAREAHTVFMDEPFTGLDQVTAAAAENQVFDLLEIGERKCVIISHNLSFAVKRASSVLVLMPGRNPALLRRCSGSLTVEALERLISG